MSDTPSAPRELSARSKRLWRTIVSQVELSVAEVELLRGGLIALDRSDEAARVLAQEGVTVLDRYGTAKGHPAVDVELRNKALFARAVAQLNLKLPDQAPRVAGRAKPGPRPKLTRERRLGAA